MGILANHDRDLCRGNRICSLAKTHAFHYQGSKVSFRLVKEKAEGIAYLLGQNSEIHLHCSWGISQPPCPSVVSLFTCFGKIMNLLPVPCLHTVRTRPYASVLPGSGTSPQQAGNLQLQQHALAACSCVSRHRQAANLT